VSRKYVSSCLSTSSSCGINGSTCSGCHGSSSLHWPTAESMTVCCKSSHTSTRRCLSSSTLLTRHILAAVWLLLPCSWQGSEWYEQCIALCRSKRLLVPANTISRVIGRGGCNINAIRDISTAQVEIDRSRDSTTERIITIKWELSALTTVTVCLSVCLSVCSCSMVRELVCSLIWSWWLVSIQYRCFQRGWRCPLHYRTHLTYAHTHRGFGCQVSH